MRKLFIRSMLLSLLFAPEAAEFESRHKRNKGAAKRAANPACANPPTNTADNASNTADTSQNQKGWQVPGAEKPEDEA